jgi:hypothetical protein
MKTFPHLLWLRSSVFTVSLLGCVASTTGCAVAAGPVDEFEDVVGVGAGPHADGSGSHAGSATYEGNGNHGLLGSRPFGSPASGPSTPYVYADDFKPTLGKTK